MLAEDAIKAAVKDYEAKRAMTTAAGGEATTGDKAATAWFLPFHALNDDENNHLFGILILFVNQLCVKEHLFTSEFWLELVSRPDFIHIMWSKYLWSWAMVSYLLVLFCT